MKLTSYILGTLIGTLCLLSCSDDVQDEFAEDQILAFGISASWKEGRSLGTRAVPDNIMDETGSAIGLAYEDYPTSISVKADDAQDVEYFDFSLDKKAEASVCTPDHTDYYLYDASTAFFVRQAKLNNFRFSAWTTIDDVPNGAVSTSINNEKIWSNVPTFGFCDYLYHRFVYQDDGHVLFSLKHYNALMRLFYAVDSEYANVRNVVVRNVMLYSLKSDGTVASSVDLAPRARFSEIDGSDGFLLTTDPQAYSYVYVNPDNVKVLASASASTKFKLECTYDVYDEDSFDSTGKPIDDDISAHCTRKSVTAESAPFTLKSVSISSFEAGRYYDLNITINPDYLYVLSEHDDNPVTVK